MNILRYISTISNMKFIQIIWRLKYKFLGYSKVLECDVPNNVRELNILLKEADTHSLYIKRFNPDDILKNKIWLLNENIDFRLGKWHYEEKTHLWNFNLHYFEYAITLGVRYQQTKKIDYFLKYRELYIDWHNHNNSVRSDGWHPYTISLRIVNVLVANELFALELEKDLEFKSFINFSLYMQFLFLEKNQELHLLGNHYFENIKALYILSVYFQDKKRQRFFAKKMLSVLSHQILDDGMHYELSFMYQHILIEDLLRVYACSLDSKFKEKLKKYIYKMLDASNYMEMRLNRLPLFNDAGEGISKNIELLNASANELMKYEYKSINRDLNNSGYYRFDDGNFTLLIDCGRVGPDEQPGHGHCDALSFEFFFKGSPLIVNSGTHQYQSELRTYFRSTKAHNTIVINDHEQSDCWGEHRVGRRIRSISAKKEDNMFLGSFRNMYGEIHKRSFELTNNEVSVIDEVFARKIDSVKGYLHIHPDYKCINQTRNKINIISKQNNKLLYVIKFYDIKTITVYRNGEFTYYSEEFGKLKNCTTIEYVWSENIIKQKYIIRKAV